MDRTPPVTRIEGVPWDWERGPVTVTLSSNDASTPPAITYYRIADGPVTAYAGPVTFDTEGSHTIWFWAKDSADPANVEVEQSRVVRIDRTGPALNTDVKAVYAGRASFSFGLTDALSGPAIATWRLDGASVPGGKVSGNQAVVAAPGAHVLTWVGLDIAGNEATGSVGFTVKRAQSLTRTPAKSAVTLTRVGGAATYRTAATLRATSATAPYTAMEPVAGASVRLQRSTDGGRTWKTVATRTTSATGAVSYSVRITKPGKALYRWYAPADADRAYGASPVTSVTVR